MEMIDSGDFFETVNILKIVFVLVPQPSEFIIFEDDAIVTGLGSTDRDGFKRGNVFILGEVAGIINPALVKIGGLRQDGDGKIKAGDEETHKFASAYFVLSTPMRLRTGSSERGRPRNFSMETLISRESPMA